MVLAECKRGCLGAEQLTEALTEKNTSVRTVYNIMKEHELAESCPAKAKIKTQMGKVWAAVL